MAQPSPADPEPILSTEGTEDAPRPAEAANPDEDETQSYDAPGSLAPTNTRAAAADQTEPEQANPTVLEEQFEEQFEQELRWAALRETLTEHHHRHQTEAWALAGAGLLGLAGGVAMAVAGREDPQWLANGLTTLSFAAINLPLGLLQLDWRGRRRNAIESLGEPASFDEVLERELNTQRGKRMAYAVNGALDVLYILVGGLLVAGADRFRHPASSRGAGWALVHQGAVLLALDLIGVARASRRLRRAKALRGL